MRSETAVDGPRKYMGEAALLLATIFWGGTFVIVKNSLSDASSTLFVGIRFLIAAFILFPFVYKGIKDFNSLQLRKSVVLGLLLFSGFVTQTLGLRLTSATKSGFITGSIVMFIPLFQLIMEKKKPTLGTVTGSFIVLAGLIFLSSKGTSLAGFFNELGGNFNTGDILTLLCAVFFAIHIVYLDEVSREVDYLPLLFVQLSVTSVLSFIAAFIFDSAGQEKLFINPTGNLFFGLFYTAIFATIVTMGLQTRFQKEVTPAKAGIIYSFEPIFSAVFAFFMLGEILTGFGLLGCVLIFLGLITSEVLEMLRKQKNKVQIEESSRV